MPHNKCLHCHKEIPSWRRYCCDSHRSLDYQKTYVPLKHAKNPTKKKVKVK